MMGVRISPRTLERRADRTCAKRARNADAKKTCGDAFLFNALMTEMADVILLNRIAERRESSTLSERTSGWCGKLSVSQISEE